jgi:hypothetical protein
VARGIDKVCQRCGVIHFSVQTETSGDQVYFELVVTKWPCTAPATGARPSLADVVLDAVSDAAA